MNHFSLDPDEIYAYGLLIICENTDQSITYANSSSDPSVLKYRYQHIAKIDAEIIYKKIAIGGSFRYNDFMQNIDSRFTHN